MNKAIGGFFELELPLPTQMPYSAALKFQSARSAFLALLRRVVPSRVWMPRYICDSMLAPLTAAGIKYEFYSIDQKLSLNKKIELKSNDWLFYVNYFGICEINVEQILMEYNPEQVVLDNSQAFFSKPKRCLATIYSPRKFLGIPDGGFLITSHGVEIPAEIDITSVNRCSHLLGRLDSGPEANYSRYQCSEEALNQLEPKRMSKLTEYLIKSVDFEAVRLRRNKNFKQLHDLLGNKNILKIDSNTINGPLCYPFLIENSSLRTKLIEQKIFVATYWTEVQHRPNISKEESFFANNLLALPCDQRYSENDITWIVKNIQGVI